MRPDPGDRVRLADLPKLYRDHAAMLRLWGGAEQSAIVLEHAAKLLEESLEGHLDERLSLAEAELESGHTQGNLRRLRREGKMPIQDDGTVLRRHVPKKPGYAIAGDLSETPSSRLQLARAVADGG